MEYLWDEGANDVKEVHRAVGRRRRITLNTVQSTLKRLFEKELLRRDKVSHAYVYTPRVTREGFHEGLLQQVVGGLLTGEGDSMLAAFVDLTERAGPEQLARLEELVSERLSQNDLARIQ